MPRLNLSEALARVQAERSLGLPVPEGAPHRTLKKLEAAVTYPFLRRQARFNEAVADALVHLRAGLDEQAVQLNGVGGGSTREEFAQHMEGVGALRRDLVALQQQVRFLDRQVDDASRALRSNQGHLDLFLNEVRDSLPEPLTPERISRLPTAWDGLYNAFEEIYRGSFELIRERLEVYLPDLPGGDLPVLDMGCGRGEWLDLLKDRGVPAYGVDLTESVVQNAKRRGLDVRQGDVIAHLRSLEPQSLQAVTAFHVAEHLDTETLIAFVDLAFQRLVPGGVLILETPNPRNVTVGATTFYLDPTHRNPIPSQLLSFLVHSRGFDHVEIRELDRADKPLTETDDAQLGPIVDLLNTYFGAAPDYAVIGKR